MINWKRRNEDRLSKRLLERERAFTDCGKIKNGGFREELPKANSIFEIGIVEQIKGYRSYYKVRFGSYRIGLKIESKLRPNDSITVLQDFPFEKFIE